LIGVKRDEPTSALIFMTLEEFIGAYHAYNARK
jgi:hypothetical protein